MYQKKTWCFCLRQVWLTAPKLWYESALIRYSQYKFQIYFLIKYLSLPQNIDFVVNQEITVRSRSSSHHRILILWFFILSAAFCPVSCQSFCNWMQHRSSWSQSRNVPEYPQDEKDFFPPHKKFLRKDAGNCADILFVSLHQLQQTASSSHERC